MNPDWQPHRKAALEQLQAFLPHAGQDYSRSRNHDFGPERRGNVSTLSPWVRHRLVLEQELVAGARALHGDDKAEKFIQEVFWRTYWKGWLELRPAVWHDYLAELGDHEQALDDRPELRKQLERAVRGETGIDCFDAWTRELCSTGYLHNHARMWFASIWIFTLELPWTLGADFFLRNLLDGDPASNTLSWRWVAGRQTPGKTYLARASNISKFTDRRFIPEPGQLAPEARAPASIPPNPEITPLLPPESADSALRTGLLLTEEDLYPESLPDLPPIAAVAASHWASCRSSAPVADHVLQFTRSAQADALARAADHWHCETTGLVASADPRAILTWSATHGIEQLAIPWVPTGPARDRIDLLQPELEAAGLRVYRPRREWDSASWPHARAGFFRFRKAIPRLMDELLST